MTLIGATISHEVAIDTEDGQVTWSSSSSSFLPPLTGELPHGQQLVWKFYMILDWRERLWVSRSEVQLIPRWRQKTHCYLSHDLAYNAWKEVGVELMRQTLSLSRAGQHEIKWEASSVGSPLSLHNGSAGKVPLLLLQNLATSFSSLSHPANRRYVLSMDGS